MVSNKKNLKDNMVVITTSLRNNIISNKRRENLINNFNKYNIPILFNIGKKEQNKHFFELMRARLETFKKTKYDYAILCDDDFYPIDNFMEELMKTVELLPDNWECLHLCPGYLWGRKFRDKNKIGRLNPEYNMEGVQFHKSGRYYLKCNSKEYFNKNFWLGGPISILVNRNTVNKLLNAFVSMYNSENCNNDVVFTKILNNNSFICRQPQLGYENEEGGSTF